jgi:hypothetical protein
LFDREMQDLRAAEAVALFCYQVKKWIGAFAAALGVLDTLVFAGGIGENAPPIRSRICDGLGFLGIELKEKRNATNEGVISAAACVMRSAIRTTWAGEMHPFEVMGYADYMQTPEFAQSLEELIRLANQDRIVLMCAEAVPLRCYRSLLADALLIRGIRTEDIMSATRRQVHTLTPFAKVRGTTITYPAEASRSTPKKPSAKRSWPQPGVSRYWRV